VEFKVTKEGYFDGFTSYIHQIGTDQQTYAYVWMGKKNKTKEQDQVASMFCQTPAMIKALENNLAYMIELRDNHLNGAAAIVRAILQKKIEETELVLVKAYSGKIKFT